MRSRVLVPELMDNPAIDRGEHARALRGLARINRLSRAARTMWRATEATAMRLGSSGATVAALDVATGSGDVPLGMASLADRRGVRIALVLCDVSATALSEARANAERLGVSDVEVRQSDVVGAGLPFEENTFAIVTSSLFMHHLRREECIAVLREMARVTAASGILVMSDLRRSRAGLAAAWIVGRTLTRSHVVRVDAVRSVRAAFSIEEMEAMAMEAGLGDRGRFRISRVWPWRMTLHWSPA